MFNHLLSISNQLLSIVKIIRTSNSEAYLGLDLALPGHLHQVDADTVCDHKCRQVPDILRVEQELHALPETQLGLLLL